MQFDASTLCYDAYGLIQPSRRMNATANALMMAWMNRELSRRPLPPGASPIGHAPERLFGSRAKPRGHVQELVDLRVDCDRDCLLVVIRQTGPACHTNRRSCFYTAVRDGSEVELMAPEA